VTLLPHVALLACLLLVRRGSPIPEGAFIAILAVLPVWVILLNWRKPLWRAKLLGPGIILAGVAACIGWIIATDAFGSWTGLAVLVLIVLATIYWAYCSLVFAIADLFRR
jgi:hypothetical protein